MSKNDKGNVPPVEADPKLMKRRAELLFAAKRYVEAAEEYAVDSMWGPEHEMFLIEQYDFPAILRKLRKARRRAYARMYPEEAAHTEMLAAQTRADRARKKADAAARDEPLTKDELDQ
jgi:hypothetical protein